MTKRSVRLRLSIVLVTTLASGAEAQRTAPQEVFWSSLQAICGRAFAGRLTEASPPDSAMQRASLIMHVRSCSPGEVRIPFHVDSNRSRTWVLTRTPEGLRLKHDHRHADGTEDAVTQYGGDTKDAGSNGRQEFQADAHTASLIPAASTNIWTVEIVPGARFVYALRRVGTDRRFRVEFDLTQPVVAQAQSAADTIRRLDSLWARMYQTHDTTFAKQLYAEDLVWTMVNGNIKDKRAEMTDVAPAAGLVMEYFRTSGVDVRIPTGSNAAIVTGLAEWRFTMNGQARQVARRYTHVYARGGPLGWRIEAVHMGQAPSR